MRSFEAGTSHTIEFRLNGRAVRGQAEARLLLSDFLRHELGMTGTHVGCEHGVCGACTIRVNGKVVRACLFYAPQIDGKSVETVEGLGEASGALDALQTAFRKHHALQCGFCTPGILISLETLIEQEPDATEARIRDVLSGHLCRCTGYQTIVDATVEVLAQRRAADTPDTSGQQRE
ncbi:MAG: (2Fe-2S)-binding protein [Gammaproteobacteria bacterium]